MRHAAWFLVSPLCATAFSQSAPDGNTAAAGARMRIESLKLFGPRKPAAIRLPAGSLRAASAPLVCAIPLLNVKPGPANDRMPVVKPPVSAAQDSRELKLRVPAPACDEKLFQNQ